MQNNILCDCCTSRNPNKFPTSPIASLACNGYQVCPHLHTSTPRPSINLSSSLSLSLPLPLPPSPSAGSRCIDIHHGGARAVAATPTSPAPRGPPRRRGSAVPTETAAMLLKECLYLRLKVGLIVEGYSLRRRECRGEEAARRGFVMLLMTCLKTEGPSCRRGLALPSGNLSLRQKVCLVVEGPSRQPEGQLRSAACSASPILMLHDETMPNTFYGRT